MGLLQVSQFGRATQLAEYVRIVARIQFWTGATYREEQYAIPVEECRSRLQLLAVAVAF